MASALVRGLPNDATHGCLVVADGCHDPTVRTAALQVKLAPMRSSFAIWGKRHGFYPVQHTKTRGLPTRNGRPSREMLSESAGILRPASKQRLKSP